MAQRLHVTTTARCTMVDITAQLASLLAGSPAGKERRNGFLAVASTHTTCGVTVNEGYDPDVQRDMTAFLSRLVPVDAGFRHAEGNSDAHIKTALFGTSALVPVEEGRLSLGQWQAVYLCECDGPRRRTLLVAFLPEG